MDDYAVDTRGNIWGVNSSELLSKMSKGIMGFNGRVSTPNYKLVNDEPIERSDEEMALDPYSDEVVPSDGGSADEAMDIVEGRVE